MLTARQGGEHFCKNLFTLTIYHIFANLRKSSNNYGFLNPVKKSFPQTKLNRIIKMWCLSLPLPMKPLKLQTFFYLLNSFLGMRKQTSVLLLSFAAAMTQLRHQGGLLAYYTPQSIASLCPCFTSQMAFRVWLGRAKESRNNPKFYRNSVSF